MENIVTLETKIEEFDRFVDRLPPDATDSLRFVPVKGNKAADVPEERDLKKDEYWLDLEEARSRLKDGENVGTVLREHLCVLVVLDPEEVRTFSDELPTTLEVNSRSGEIHRYYLRGDGIESKDIPGVAELRTGCRYVVAPGSCASNGSGDKWGVYTVEDPKEIAEITREDLPAELKPKKELGVKGNTNEHGWRIEKIREEDEVLDALLTRERPPNLGFMSKEDADRKTIEKLLFWEFHSGIIPKIMKEYRGCGEEVSSLYTEVFSEFKSDDRDVISDARNVENFRPGSKRNRLTGKVKKELEDLAYADDRVSWDCETEFITFTQEVPLQSGEKIGEGETLELPLDLAETMVEDGKAVEHAWMCQWCGEIQEMRDKPSVCPNPNCTKDDERFNYPFEAIHPLTHDEIGEAIMDNYDFVTARDRTQQLFVLVNNAYSGELAEAIVKEKVRQLVPDAKKGLTGQVVDYIQGKTFVDRDRLGLPPRYLAVENGILDLEDRELVNAEGLDHYPLARIPIEFDPEADCPRIEDFVGEIVGRGYGEVLQEITGYCLWKRYFIKKAVMLLGPGDNAKSTFLNLLRRFLGKENVASPSLQDLSDNRFVPAELYGKLANICADIPNESLEDTGKFKMATGRDLMRGELKGKDAFKFENYAKLLYSANELPETRDKTPAFYGRWVIVPFPHVFAEDPDPHEKEADPDILENLTREDELSGFLNWALDGLDRLRERNAFSNPGGRKDIEALWISKTDSLKAFANREVEVAPGYFITKDDLHRVYTAWCEEKGVEAEILSKQKVGSELPRKIGQTSACKPKVDGKRENSWRDIRFKRDELEKYNHESKEAEKDRAEKDVGDVRDIYSFSVSDGIHENQSTEERNGGRGKTPDFRDEPPRDGPDDDRSADKGKNPPDDDARELGKVEDLGEEDGPSESPPQRDKVSALTRIVREVGEAHESGAPVTAVKEEAESEGISPGFVEEFVKRGREKGRLILSEEEGERFVEVARP